MTSAPAAGHPAPPEHPELPDGVAPRARAPRWPAWTAPAALIAGFGAAVAAALVIGAFAAIFGASLDHPPPSVSIASVVVQDVCLIGAALLFARTVATPRPWQFGLRRPRSLPAAIGWVVAGYLTFVGVSYAWLSAIGQTNAKDTITEDLGAGGSTAAMLGVTFVVCVAAPLAEELFFRGYFFGALRPLGLWPAALLTGLAFGLVHVFGSPIAFIVPLALLGGLLCLIRERTGSLYPGIALHCINNSVALSSSEHWSWQVPVVLVAAPALIALIVRAGLRVWNRDPAALRAPALP
jgi:uncharacterized protein